MLCGFQASGANYGSGKIICNGDMRAPIFYDSNDTAYYFDGSADLALRAYGEICNSNFAQGNLQPGALNIGRIDTNYDWGGTWAVDTRVGILANCADKWEFAIHDSGERVVSPFAFFGGASSNYILMGRDIGWGTTYIVAASSFRAPIFYDNDNTGYYYDGSGTTNINILNINTLNVNGDQYIYTANPTIHFVDSNERGAAIHVNSNLFYILSSNGTGGTYWTTNSGQWPFYINLNDNNATFGGAIYAVGNITAYSDIKLKENIYTIDSALDKVLQLRGVYYNLKRDENKIRKVGVVAQEIQTILPEVVHLHRDKEDKEGTLAVDYGNITAILIEAIKEQQIEIQEMKSLINKLLAEKN
jgi:predicted outer membrane repeat protein